LEPHVFGFRPSTHMFAATDV